MPSAVAKALLKTTILTALMPSSGGILHNLHLTMVTQCVRFQRAWQPRRLVASRPPEMSVSMMPSQLSGLSLGGAELPPNVTLVSMTGPYRERHLCVAAEIL
jgi:hypothetical protein